MAGLPSLQDLSLSFQDSLKSTSEAVGGAIKVGNKYVGSGSPFGIVKVVALLATAVLLIKLLKRK